MTQIFNIAAYKFVSLENLEQRRLVLLEQTQAQTLKGTILLTPEGINLFLAGIQENIEQFLVWLRQDPAFADLEVKYSVSPDLPFKKMLIKIKREIIRMNHPTIRPEAGRAPAVDAQTAARWITQGRDDTGRPVVLLDTRNDFEVDAGTFVGAINWQLTKFTEFPQAVLDHKDELAGKTIISFCTGGIRCEKAAIFMGEVGIENVYQLDGGILKYFEQTGGVGYQGNCFVFDERRTVDSTLQPQPLT
ncbi:COG1054 Predicted sulfurtransferase [Burkholderiaceae bacterium]